MRSHLLIHEEPLQVLPSLAVAVGLNEAIILQQVHYWLKRTEHLMEGKPWVYNSYVQWRGQFPFWSHDTIKRAIQHLESLEILISTARFNRKPIDKTKWYTINYARLNDVCGSSTMQNAPTTMQNAPTLAHSAPMDDAKCTDHRCNLHPLPEITTEITPEISDPPLIPPGGKAARRCPADYVPTEEVKSWAQRKYPQINFADALEAMMDWEFKTPRRDWHAVLRTWIRNEAKRLPVTTPPGPRLSREEARARADEQSTQDLEDLVYGRNTRFSVWAPLGRDGAGVPGVPRLRSQSRLSHGTG